jgi:hypothetical protein
MDNEPLAPPKTTRIIGIVLLLGTVFIASLWLGHWLGNSTRRAITAAWSTIPGQAAASEVEKKHARRSGFQPKQALMDSSASQLAVNHQRNILLIGIDSFQAEEPRLEGVWMILYLRDLPHFMLVPVYPNRTPGEQNSAVVDQNLAHLFTLDDNQAPGNLFFQALKDKELWWNGYLVLDRAALSEIIALTAGEDEAANKGQQLSASDIPDLEEEPMHALLGQVQIAQGLCRNFGVVLASDNNRFPALIAKASAYMHTDLDLGEIAREVNRALRYGGGISCEFPSFATASSLP